MRADVWLKKSADKLKKAHIGSPKLDAIILLEDELGKDRSYILAHPEIEISKTKLKRLDAKIKRRAGHLPLAFIRGQTQFYGRKFLVNRHTLEPRPESETMIELLKQLAKAQKLKAENLWIADVGTGSGCLGITAALELHTRNVDLYDIDASVLAVAKHNLAVHELSLKTYKRDLLSRHARPYDVILANLPYVPNRMRVNQAAAMEPRIAIFGGEDGLDIYRRLFKQLQRFDWQPKFVFTESLPPQHEDLSQIASEVDFKLRTTEDFVQIFTSL